MIIKIIENVDKKCWWKLVNWKCVNKIFFVILNVLCENNVK